MRLNRQAGGRLVPIVPAGENKKAEGLQLKVQRPLSSHGGLYHLEDACITLDPFSAQHGIGESMRAALVGFDQLKIIA